MQKSQEGQGCGYEGKQETFAMTEPCRIFNASTSFQALKLRRSFAECFWREVGRVRGPWCYFSQLLLNHNHLRWKPYK